MYNAVSLQCLIWLQISFEPRDVTSFGADDVAITIMRKQIFIVTVTGNRIVFVIAAF
jgi:hypothetical protein